MRLSVLAAMSVICTVSSAYAATDLIGPPSIRVGNGWTYRDTNDVRGHWSQQNDQITVSRVEPDAIAIDLVRVGLPVAPVEQPVGVDWSRVRSVDGRMITVNRPLNFPLRVGKVWTVDYTEHNPNRQHALEHYRTPYRVVGWEDVTVAAGTFKALKIEADGDWSATAAPSVSGVTAAHVDAFGTSSFAATTRQPRSAGSGRTYKAFWYVPSVKRCVKSEEDWYSSGGIETSSYKTELLSFKTAS